MNPQFDKQTNLNLPPPVPEMPVSANTAEQQPVPNQPEASPAAAEKTAMSSQATATPAAPVFVPPVLNEQGSVASNAAKITTAPPAAADDNDLIEKEWVTKAKEIVEKTKEDPYIQSKEMTNFKADYMKKRYNKTIKSSE